MAGDILRHGDSGTITRQALGRIARLGTLYDARTDTFCAMNMFKQQLPPDSPAVSLIDNRSTSTSITISSSLNDKLEKLDIKGELKLSIISGMCELVGSAKYLKQEKTSYKSVESSLLYKVSTKHESLDLYNMELKSYISIDALSQTTATHVVVEIYWGANCAITVTDENSENNKQKDVEVNLKAQMEHLRHGLTVSLEIGKQAQDSQNWSKYSVEIFGDVLPDEFPSDVDGALSTLRNMEQLIQKCNDGKGKPLTFVMLPLTCQFFQEYIGLKEFKVPTVGNLGEGRITQAVHLLDHITELRQLVHDQVVELNSSRCVRASELKDVRFLENSLEVLQGDVKSDFVPLLKDIRSLKSDGQCLEDFCNKHRTTADEKFDKCKSIYQAVRSRITFAEVCEKYGAKYLEYPIQHDIDKACDEYENVYVLFDGQSEAETTKKNQSAFRELAKSSRNDGTTAFYFTWADCNGQITIEHYRRNKRVFDDVVKEMETKNMVQCAPAVKRAYCLMPIKLRCPGSYDGYCSREELPWTCIKCNELMRFCPDDSAVYCGCGHATTLTHEFQFRCGSEAHGSEFTQFKDGELLELLTSSASCSGNYLLPGSFVYFGPRFNACRLIQSINLFVQKWIGHQGRMQPPLTGAHVNALIT